jgi:hypothetical protein
MKVVYMEQTLKIIAKLEGVAEAKRLEAEGEIKYVGDTPYLLIIKE